MEIKTNAHKKRLIKMWLWLVFVAIILIGFVSTLLILNYGDRAGIVYTFGIMLILCCVGFFPYIIFMTKFLELLSTQKVFFSEKYLLFYFTRRDGGPEGFGEQHFYDLKKEVSKVKKNRLFISVKGVFQTKTEGFPTLEMQNPDDEASKLTFDEQVGLIYFEDSYLKKKTLRILRVFDKDEEELLLKLISEEKVEIPEENTEDIPEEVEEIPEEKTEETTENKEETADVN